MGKMGSSSFHGVDLYASANTTVQIIGREAAMMPVRYRLISRSHSHPNGTLSAF